ncbi:hypothetical protein BpHYR1_039901 [Brachionus plicatilis]|uniref:Uncharacterized protein n=1 Tax=Brachionus plicatilis TaxID=10195 RepID=A0A3M7R2Y3_BRAPC|nr:hypothetical protein BpHYR1_039901 [Brachionus plicatilis]
MDNSHSVEVKDQIFMIILKNVKLWARWKKNIYFSLGYYEIRRSTYSPQTKNCHPQIKNFSPQRKNFQHKKY